jgi:hypothetical protein
MGQQSVKACHAVGKLVHVRKSSSMATVHILYSEDSKDTGQGYSYLTFY